MSKPRSAGARIDSGFCIFILDRGEHSDLDWMRLLAIEGYERAVEGADRSSRVLHFAGDGVWTQIYDGWGYYLWNSPTVRAAVAAIGAKFPVFFFSVGDCDDSFEFAWYQGGVLRRRHVVDVREVSRGGVMENFGPPLPGEAAALACADRLKAMQQLAAGLGVQLEHPVERVRSYEKRPEASRSMAQRIRRALGWREAPLE